MMIVVGILAFLKLEFTGPFFQFFPMHLGFGLYRHQLDRDHYRFARQCGATNLVAHFVDYFNQGAAASDQPVTGGRG